jgi:hypothetical protein
MLGAKVQQISGLQNVLEKKYCPLAIIVGTVIN